MTRQMIHTFVPGTPVPQGSVNAYHGRIVAVTPKLREWRNKIRAATMAKHEGEPLDGPLHVSLAFQLARPKRPRWMLPAVKPDLDKLTRAVFDSLSTTSRKGIITPGVITDDARIVSFTAAKAYHHTTGVMITIMQSEEQS